MKKILCALALLTLATAATAATGVANITWLNPSSYTDNTPLPLSAITETQIYCEFTPIGSTVTSDCANGAPAAFAGSVASGTYTFTYPAQGGRACFYIRTRAGTGVSDPSSPKACKDFAPLKPNAPGNVTVTVTVSVMP